MELIKQNGSINCSWPNVTNPGDGKSSSSRAEQVALVWKEDYILGSRLEFCRASTAEGREAKVENNLVYSWLICF